MVINVDDDADDDGDVDDDGDDDDNGDGEADNGGDEVDDMLRLLIQSYHTFFYHIITICWGDDPRLPVNYFGVHQDTRVLTHIQSQSYTMTMTSPFF